MASLSKRIRLWFTSRYSHKAERLRRRLRYLALRPLRMRQPQAFLGRIVCHIMDFNRTPDLGSQLDYLVARGVRTFRIYTNRRDAVAETVASRNAAGALSVAIVPRASQAKVWKDVDDFDWTQSHDKWSLVLRAGEYLLYPHFESRSLPDLCQFLSDEHRRAFFALALDAYRADRQAMSFKPGDAGWSFDRYGYEFHFAARWQTELWYGGFLQRFRYVQRAFSRAHITRVPLIKISRTSLHARNFAFAYPLRLNAASSKHHLSPTGCIVSAEAFQYWVGHAEGLGRSPDFDKLLAAPSQAVSAQHDDYAANGFMNLGQWM